MCIIGGKSPFSYPTPLRLSEGIVSLLALRCCSIADVALCIHLHTESIAVEEAERTRGCRWQFTAVLAEDFYTIGI